MKPGSRGKDNRAAVEAKRLERQTSVGRMLVNGATQQQIADRLGIARQTVIKDTRAIFDAWRAEHQEIVGSILHLQHKRLELLWSALINDIAQNGADPAKIVAGVRVVERISALYGLDKLPTTQVTVNNINIEPVDYRASLAILAPSEITLDAEPDASDFAPTTIESRSVSHTE